MKTPRRFRRAVADWIRARLLRITATPYECYWRDRAFAAEAEVAQLRKMNTDCRRFIEILTTTE